MVCRRATGRNKHLVVVHWSGLEESSVEIKARSPANAILSNAARILVFRSAVVSNSSAVSRSVVSWARAHLISMFAIHDNQCTTYFHVP